jgi:hypothetical protein
MSCAALAMSLLSGCVVAKTTGKVAAAPFKVAYKTTELTAKGVVGTGKVAGKTVIGTGKFAGQSAFAVGKGVYYVGSVPVKITDKALDTTTKVLTITTQAVDLTGKVVTTSRQIQASELDAELRAIKSTANIIGVMIDAFG